MSIRCKAALTGGDGKFFIDEIEVDRPGPDEVLVQIKAAGICHTDYDSLRWGRTMILGHEGSGIVVESGTAVTGLFPGDRVVLNWAIPCGHCFQCQRGNEHLCEINSPVTAGNRASGGHARLEATRHKGSPVSRSFNIGTLSEYTLVKAPALVRNHVEEMSFAAASIISCGVMTGYGSVMNAARVPRGASVVVLGCGGVGLNVIQAARIASAGVVIAIDVHEQRLQMARRFGATHGIKAFREDRGLQTAAEEVKLILGGRLADYAFECTAVPELGAAPLAMVRNAGMAVQVSGIEQEISFDMNLFEWDKTYINPLYGQCRPSIDFPKIMDHYSRGSLLLEELITKTYPLQQLSQAFDDLLAGRNAKGVILFD